MNVMVLPELFAKRAHFTLIHSTYLINKYNHLINWKKDPSILEFGFADGSTSKSALQPLLPPDYKEFVAADISEHMLEYCKEKKSNIPKNSKLVQLDISTDKLSDDLKGRFDHIFSFFTIHAVQNTRQAFKNIYEMLKPGGENFNVFFDCTPIDYIFHKFSQDVKWNKYKQNIMLSPYYYEPNREESLKRDVRQAGFEDISFRRDDFTYEFPNDDAWKENYFAVNPSIPYIPKEHIEEYKKSYFEQIKKSVFVVNTDDSTRPKIKCAVCTLSIRKSLRKL